MMSFGGNMKKRKFQHTGFGLDRDVSAGDKLPVWKQAMFDRVRNRSKQHRQTLLKRLEQQRYQNKNLSPNSKKVNANNTIDSFKKALVEHEMKQYQNNQPFKPNINLNRPHIQNNHNFNNNTFGNNNNFNNNNNKTFNNNHNHNNNYHSFENEEDIDIESAHLNAEQYKMIFAELERYLEETELSELRQKWAKSFEEMEQDQEKDAFEEVLAAEASNNPHVVYCPICCKHMMDIEYINNNQPVYSCLCGTRFQPRDKNVSIPIKVFKNHKVNFNQHQNGGLNLNEENKENMNWSYESDVDHGRRMLKVLRNNLNSLMEYHSKQKKCHQQLNFAVVDETGYLQAWCCQCHCNEIVI